MKQNLVQDILNKPLTRRQFLQHIGVMLLAVFGISQMLQHLLKHDSSPTPTKIAASRWGGGKFGV